MLPLAYFGIESSGLNLAVDLLILFVVVLYLVADLLDLRRRAPADRRPDAGRLRDRGLAVPVRGHDRLHDPAPARVPRGRARARTRDAGRRGAPARARPVAVPALRLPHRARLRALPELPAQAQGALRELLAPARPGVDDLPLLRGRGARHHARGARAGAAPAAALERGVRAATELDGGGAPSRRRQDARRADGEAAEPPVEVASRPTPRRAEPARAARPGARGVRGRPPEHTPSKGSHGPNADPRQARRLRPRAERRDHRPLRAQGAARSSRCAT